ncbi:MAG: PEP-CTERM sorting domain-containing protein, partial [Verrucomicrobia bacterium]|nr:PEP-CTERM sorting domain-containing protein [Verrucomicrobiota bacterium]
RIYTYWTVNGGTGTGIHIRDDKTTITDFPDAAGLMSDPMVLVNGTVIPEPATLGMVALFGGGLLFIRRRLML